MILLSMEMAKSFQVNVRPLTDETFFRGQKNAPIVIVEYSDFQCPDCARGEKVIDQLMKKYPSKVKLIYKHFILGIFPYSSIVAQYFEAIALQDTKKAWAFGSKVFENQRKLRRGVKILDKIAKDLNVDRERLKKDLRSSLIIEKIRRHTEEAQSLGLRGAPSFILNGVTIKEKDFNNGDPLSSFERTIKTLVKKEKLIL
jgi:protein-disulfide isomerase